MSDSKLDVLKQHRNALLLAEVGACLHMLGKFHEDFLKGNHELATDIPADLTTDYPELDKLLREAWAGAIWAQLPVQEFQANDLGIYDLIKQHQERGADKGFLRLMQDAHGRGSGIEKGVLNRFAPPQSGIVYLATAVGKEVEAIDLKELSNWRKDLYTFLQTQLGLLRDQQARVNWSEFRKPFIQRLARDFRPTVAETRRPLNDVTLFDQTMASVAFFKAALAQNLLVGWQEPNERDVKRKYHWRILRAGLDGLAYWGQSARVNDLLSRKALVDPALNRVRNLLEETYPLGMEIYRDENGSLFIAPDINNLLRYDAEGVPLEERLQEIADQSFGGEVRFDLQLSERTRNTLSFGQLATAPLPPPSPFPTTVETWWNGIEGRDVCPVCGLRPQGPTRKALERKVCHVCEQRRADRAKKWAGELHTTVWVDEAADMDGRVALVVGRFGLESWLRGEAFNTVMVFAPADGSDLQYEQRGKRYAHKGYRYSDLLQEIAEALIHNAIDKHSTPLLNYLLRPFWRLDSTGFAHIYDYYVSDTDLSNSTREAWRFALALVRQWPAFARLRRVWETARGFWAGSLSELEDKTILPAVAKRLSIRAGNSEQFDLGPYHAYELDLGPTTMAVVHRNGHLITVDNLQCIARLLGAEPETFGDPERAARFVQNCLEEQKTCVIQQPSEYGMSSRLHSPLQIAQVSLDLTSYQPVISILTEPRTFMSLVPARQALEIAEYIQRQYRQQFSKVQNRLPLFLGLVFFQRKTPLMAVMDTARRMLEVRMANSKWQIAKVSSDRQNVTLELEQTGQHIQCVVPVVMGDPKTPDDWYPYFELVGTPEAHHTYRFEYDGKTWVHIKNLHEGETVRVTPSLFTYLFLESTAQRFHFDPELGVMLLEELPRLMKMWKRLKDSEITDTSLRGVAQLLDAKARLWGKNTSEFRHLTETALKKASLWQQEDKPDAVTPDDVIGGRFERCLDLHLSILKERIKKQEVSHEQ